MKAHKFAHPENACARCGKPRAPKKHYCARCVVVVGRERKRAASAEHCRRNAESRNRAQEMVEEEQYPDPQYMAGFKVGRLPLRLQRVPAERIEDVIENLLKGERL